MNNSSRRRRSISTNMPHISKSDSTSTLWNNSSSKLLSRFKPQSNTNNNRDNITVTPSISLTLPLAVQPQKIKRRPIDSVPNDNLLGEPNTKKVSL